MSRLNSKRVLWDDGVSYPYIGEHYSPSDAPFVHSKFKKRRHKRQYALYVFLLGAILFGIVQAAITMIEGTYKLTILANHQNVVNQYYQASLQENFRLKEQIRVYSAPAGIEELARNNLKMVGKDEILVRLH